MENVGAWKNLHTLFTGDIRGFETPNPHIQKMLRLTSSVKWIVIKRRNVNTGSPVPTLSTSLVTPSPKNRAN